MQRRAVELLFSSFTFLIAVSLLACGGGSSHKVGPAKTITITPVTASLDFGKFATLVASAKDATGKTVDPATITWSSSNTAVATVTSTGANGSVCAGAWDSLTTPTVCTPATTTGDVTITAKSGSASATATVSVHPQAARLVVSPISSGCLSQTQTIQLTAQAFDNNSNVIATTPASFTWTSTDANIVSIDANGVATANKPGLATINASLAGTTGLPVIFQTCAPSSILLFSQNTNPPETSFTLANGATKAMRVVLNDTKGNPIGDAQLTYSSSNPSVVTISGSGLTATVTAKSPGVTTLIASCSPPSCNPRIDQPVYSVPVTVTVSGSATQKVVVTAFLATGVVIYDTSAATSTPVAFPTVNNQMPQVNSMVISPDGAVAYMGTNLGILRLDLNAGSFLPTFNGAGVVRAISPDGTKILATNADGPTYVYDSSSLSLQPFTVTGITNGDFSVDSLKAMMVSGNTLYVYSRIASGLRQVALSGTAQDLKFSPQGSVALAAEGHGELLANCSNAAISSALGNVGTVLAKTNIADRMWGADTNNIYQIDFTGNYGSTSATDCTPHVNAASTAHSLGASVTPIQLVATPDGQRAYLVNDSAQLYAASTSGVIPISLTGGGTPLAAAVAPDSANVFVAASTGDIHRIDVGSNMDVQQIAVGLKKADGTAIAPGMIVVRNK